MSGHVNDRDALLAREQGARPAHGVRLSVITPSLNHGRFLAETIASVQNQTYCAKEHIVIDGGSTDGTVDILAAHPNIRWLSEGDRHIFEAYQKGLALASGEYIAQCCVSDGFLDRRWFEIAVDFLDTHPDVSLVWALPQYLTEDGALGMVSYAEFFDFPPPEDPAKFFAFWLATGFFFPEGNYIVRANIIKDLFPGDESPEHHRIQPHLGFVYNFMRCGYVARFFPRVVNYGRLHENQRGVRLRAIEWPAYLQYLRDVRALMPAMPFSSRKQVIVDSSGKIIGDFDLIVPGRYWLFATAQKIARSRIFSWPPCRILQKMLAGFRRND